MPKKPIRRPIVKINDWSDLYKTPIPGCSKEPESLYYIMTKTNNNTSNNVNMNKTTAEPKKRGRPKKNKSATNYINVRRSNRLSDHQNVSGQSQDSSDEETLFDKLVGKSTMIQRCYHKKTPPKVSSPKPTVPPSVTPPDVPPEMHANLYLDSETVECKNKGKIVEWLTDNQNEFDRLTQTQTQKQPDEEIMFSLDMPSVSQVGNETKSVFSFKIKRSREREESKKFRAKSLDVRVNKTMSHLKPQRHSLAGDTPSLENYHIEECITQADNVDTSDKVNALHLMEDEFLESIEQKVEKTNMSGWDRIKEITKNFARNHPKQLKVILVKSSEAQADENKPDMEIDENVKDSAENRENQVEAHVIQLENQNLIDNQNKLEDQVAIGNSYCGKAVEQFFSKTLVKIMSESLIIETSQPDLVVDGSEQLQGEESIKEFGRFLEENKEPESNLGEECEKLIKQLSTNFDMLLQKQDPCLNQLLQKLSELRLRFIECSTAVVQTSVEVSHSEVQTLPVAMTDAEVQTEHTTKLNVEVQTEKLTKMNAGTQTEGHTKICVEVQTEEPVEAAKTTSSSEVHAEESTKMNDQEKLDEVQNEETAKQNVEETAHAPQDEEINDVISIKSTPDVVVPAADKCILAETLDYFDDFETEDLLQKYNKRCGKINNECVNDEVTVVAKANDVSQSRNGTDRGTKRSQKVLDEGSQEIGRKKKRPCLQFIKDDISIIFDSDSDDDDEAGGDVVIEKSVQQPQPHGFNYSVYLEDILQKYDSEGMRIKSPPRKKRTQEVIEECEMMIANMNRTNHRQPDIHKSPVPQPPQKIETSKPQPQSDPFSNDEMFIDKENLSIIERVIDGLDRHIEADKDETLVQEENRQTQNLSRSRKRLFDKTNKESELLFTGEIAALPDDESRYITIANDNFEKILREINGDNYSLNENETDEEIVSATQNSVNKKIKVFSNIVIQAAKHVKNGEEEVETSSNDSFTSDVVETTPQKPKTLVLQRSSSSDRLNPMPDIILPPPPGFETFTANERSPPPLQPNSKITSTPRTQKPNFSESIFDDLSPIISSLQTESQRNLGPIELARQSKTSTLTIITKPTSVVTQRPRPELKQQSLLAYAQRQRSSQNSNASQKIASQGSQEISSQTSQKITSQTSQKTTSQTSQKATSQASQKNISQTSQKIASQRSNSLQHLLLQKSNVSFQHLPPKKSVYVISSRLTKEQNMGITRLVTKKLVQYSSTFDSKSTHLIVSVDSEGHLSDCTMKFMMAVAAGLWVLKFGWVEECLAKNRIVPEMPYEVLDVHGCDGPRRSRVLRLTKPLLKDFRVYCVPTFVSASVDEVMRLIRMLGGEVVEQLTEFKEQSNRYNLILAEAKLTPDVELHETWLDVYQTISVELEWLVRSVGKYDIVNVRPYLLCSDDYICDLRYPPQLTEPILLSQN